MHADEHVFAVTYAFAPVRGQQNKHLCLSDIGFGIPHQRKRCFILASLYSDARDVLLQVCVPDPCNFTCLLSICSPLTLVVVYGLYVILTRHSLCSCLAGGCHLPRSMLDSVCRQGLLLVLG